MASHTGYKLRLCYAAASVLGRPVPIGPYYRRAIAPMANHLGLDYTLAMFTPPETEQARALHRSICACNAGVVVLPGS